MGESRERHEGALSRHRVLGRPAYGTRQNSAMRRVRPHVDDIGWAKLAAAIGIDPHLGRG